MSLACGTDEYTVREIKKSPGIVDMEDPLWEALPGR
jgi:hypothetical protein